MGNPPASGSGAVFPAALKKSISASGGQRWQEARGTFSSCSGTQTSGTPELTPALPRAPPPAEEGSHKRALARAPNVQKLHLRQEPGREGQGAGDQPRLLASRVSGIFLFVQRGPGTSSPPLLTISSDKPSFYFQQHPYTQTQSHQTAKLSNTHSISAELRPHSTHTKLSHERPVTGTGTAGKSPSRGSDQGKGDGLTTSSGFVSFPSVVLKLPRPASRRLTLHTKLLLFLHTSWCQSA